MSGQPSTVPAGTASETNQAMWIFSASEQWTRGEQMYKGAQAVEFEDVIWAPGQHMTIRRDTVGFFASRELYSSIKAPWRRGLLFCGPPGNGKTLITSIILKMVTEAVPGLPLLYVKSISSSSPQTDLAVIFQRARSCAPCVLVLDHIDALLGEDEPRLRAQLLNELDGLGDNEGILLIATTNRPDKVDEAISKRPLRFDVRYQFPVPDQTLRKRFVDRWMRTKLGIEAIDFDSQEYTTGAINDIDSLGDEIAKRTEGWSFACLEELFVSFVLSRADGHFTRGADIGANVNRAVPFQDLLKHVNSMQEQVKGSKASSSSSDHSPSSGATSSSKTTRLGIGRIR